jgi:hypothetical protein
MANARVGQCLNYHPHKRGHIMVIDPNSSMTASTAVSSVKGSIPGSSKFITWAVIDWTLISSSRLRVRIEGAGLPPGLLPKLLPTGGDLTVTLSSGPTVDSTPVDYVDDPT